MQLEFLRLAHGEGLPLPAYATAGAAGMDICSAESFILLPHGRATIPTGFAVAVPDGFELQVRPRSGLAAKHGITILNTPGTVDSDYRGELKVILFNTHHRHFAINRGDRIAQLVLAPVTVARPIEVNELSSTERGSNGFGSTGISA